MQSAPQDLEFIKDFTTDSTSAATTGSTYIELDKDCGKKSVNLRVVGCNCFTRLVPTLQK